MEVNIHEAKTNLSKLIAAMEAGERVIIKRAGKPVARIAPLMEEHNVVGLEPSKASPEIQAKRRALFGSMQGKIWVSDDFDSPLPDAFWLGEE